MKMQQDAGDGPKPSGPEKHSLAYRKNRVEIWNGKPPRKYTRLLPYIKGDRIVEMGAAEGVLALMLANRGASVAAIERQAGRHCEACRLKDRYRSLGWKVDGCRMIFGDIQDHLELLKDADTFVAIRAIYYMRDEIDSLIQAVYESGVQNVVLCGNPSRARYYEDWKHNRYSKSLNKLGEYNLYASIHGMERLLSDHNYKITRTAIDGDPIVVGSVK